ncbi:hypothetical protein T07_4607 [Trichinella nelsoni]|uniref:Uncharacterized protein n=1 Tax=Trichinella nelsoni TaxID=6336 RepID=A0A0V0RMH8_9BILA|nr:hypothetical protein T07_4607 [Trichinella nelsoni]
MIFKKNLFMSSVDCAMPAVVGYPMMAWYPQTISSHSFDPFPERLVPFDIILCRDDVGSMEQQLVCVSFRRHISEADQFSFSAGGHFDTFQPFHNYYTSKSQGGHIAL